MFNTVPDTYTKPIFEKQDNINPDFNENMDEYIKSDNAKNIEEWYKNQGISEDKNINAQALDNIPKVPDFIQEQYSENPNAINLPKGLNVCTEDEIKDWEQQGPMGFVEYWQTLEKWKLMPIVGTSKEAGEAIGVAVLLDKFNKGEALSDNQKEAIVDYLRDAKKLEVRGFTNGGKVANILATGIPYAGEFAIGLAATAASGGVGFTSLAKTLSNIGAKKAARSAVEKALKETAKKNIIPAATKTTLPLSAAKKIYKDTLLKTTEKQAIANVGAKTIAKETVKSLPKAVATSSLVGVGISPLAIAGKTSERQIATGVYVTDKGQAVFSNPENLATSFMKAVGEQTFEILTETAGGVLAGVGTGLTSRLFAKPMRKILPQKFFTGFEKLAQSKFGTSATDAVKKFGYDGVIEEMGEELLNRFLCQTFGINGLEAYNFDSFMNNVFYANDPSQWGVEAASFGVMGLGGRAAAAGASAISEQWEKNRLNNQAKEYAKEVNARIYTPEQFYLDQGFVRIKGSKSLPEMKLSKIWDKMLLDKGFQNSMLGNMSESEIQEEIKNIAQQTGIKNIDESAIEVAQKEIERVYKASNKNVDDETVSKVSKVMGTMLSAIAQKENKELEEVLNRLPSVEQVNEYMYADEDGKGYTQSEINSVLELATNELYNLPDDFADENYINELSEDVRILQDLSMGKLEEVDSARAWDILNKNVQRKNPQLLQQRSLFQEMAELDKTGSAYDMPTILINGVEKQTLNSDGKPIAKTKEAIEHFYNWFGDSLVLDENGKPLVVYHGSVQTFEVFDKEKASAEGNVGAGFYFTDNEYDVDDNYYDGGPDFDNKVERLAEQIEQDEDIDYDEAKERAEAQLRGESKKYPVYLAIKNPVYIGGNKETNLFDAVSDYMPEINEEDYEDYDEYEEARYQAEDEAYQTISYQIDDELGSLLQYDDIEKAKGILFELLSNQYVTFEELKERLNQEYFQNWDTGEYVSNEVARRIAEALGYDGIIDSTVTDKFKNMGIQTGTSHYIAFRSEQIKSVDNRGTFDAQNPNIYYQPSFERVQNAFDEIKTILKAEKLADFINKFEILKEFSKELEPALDYYIDEMPKRKKRKDLSGQHLGNKIIYIDTEVIGNDFVKLISTLVHEVEHAKQYKELKEAKAKAKINRTKKDKEIIELHKNCAKVNKDKRDYYNEHKKILEPILNDLKALNKTERKEYLKNIPYEQALIYNKFDVLYEAYKNDPLEMQAQKAGKNARQKAKIIQSRILEKTRTVNGRFGQWNAGARDWIAEENYKKGSIGETASNESQKPKRYNQEIDPEQQSVFPWKKEAKKIHKVKGGYLPAEKFIELFQNADASTIVHECAHWYLDELTRIAQYNEEVAEDLEAVRKFLKNQGEEFTREQHEKFARSFEAYILTGSSRNNKLKKIFEDFKNWLLQIYDEIKNLGINMKEMPEITNLFDRLLTSEKQRSAAVFNKITTIEEKISQIVQEQEKELDILDEIYAENISANNRQSDIKRSVQEYLDLASKAAKREPKEVKEYRERYKEATYQILEAATGFDRTFIAQKRNADKVAEAINNVEDKITISGGMRPEWQEFYSDTGVDYETDEVGGDYELAQQAWQVFQDGTYKIDDSEYSEIEEFAGKFDYLYGKALTLQGEERFVALEALYSLYSDMPALPDEYIQETVKKISEIDETISEAEREAFNRKNYSSISVVEYLQRFITDKIKNLKIYNPETKYRMRLDKSHRLYRFIKGATSINKAKTIVRKINEFVIEDLRNQQRAIIHKEIQKQIRINSKVVRSGSNVKGKFDWKTNSVFMELQELNKKTKKEALEEYERLAKLGEIENSQMRDGWDEKETKFDEFKNEFDFNLKRNFIEYKSQTGRLEENAKGYRVSTLNIQLGVKILEDIIKLKEMGREAKSEEELKKKLNKRSFRNNFIELIKEKGSQPWVRKFVTHLLYSGQTLANWETTLNAIFGSEVARDFSLLDLDNAVEVKKREICNKLFNRIRKIYKLRNANAFEMFLEYDNVQQILDLFQGFEKEKYTILETSFDINTGEYYKTNTELTKGQLITLWGWYQNDNLRRRIETQYGVAELSLLFDKALSDKEKDIVWAVIDTLNEMYPEINEVFINQTGLSLPQEQNYIPSVTERIVSDLDMMHDCIMASKTPSAVKRRKLNNRIKMAPVSIMEIVLPHIDKMSRYILLQEKLNFYRAVFNNANITAAFREVYGKKDGEALHREIKNQLEDFSFGSTNKRMGKIKDFADGLAKNFIVSSIGWSPKVALGQVTSIINYSENMPVAEFGAGLAKSLANPVKTFEFMMDNSKYLQARLAGNTQNEIIANLTNEKDKFRKWTNFFTANVRWGDIITVTLGGKPYVDYLVSQGMTLEEAIKKFESETARAQQSSSASATSRWQKQQAELPVGRMFGAFKTTEFQFERKVYDAILKAARGEITPSQAIKTIIIYRVVNPVIFGVMLQQFAIAPLLRMLFGADDDPAETWRNLGISSAIAILTANLSHWGYLTGLATTFAIQTLIKKLSGDKKRKAFKAQIPFVSDAEDVITKLFKKDGPEVKDWLEAAAFVTKFKLGVPLDKIINFGEGVGNVVQGDFGIGLLRMGGWGEYTATEAMTGEAPER